MRPSAVRTTLAVLSLVTLLPVGCDRAPAPPPPSAARAGKITVASLVPAATDLLVGMGARDALVAVSNFDAPRAETAGLPRVGDYRTVDWEKLAELRPAVMVTQFRPDKMPAGLAERAGGYGIRLVNIRIVRLDDVFASIAQLGDAVGEPGKAKASAGALWAELDAVAARVAGRPRVRTFVSRTDDPLEAVGGGNFVDDLLTVAGGQNVLAGPGYDDNSFPTVDRELLLSLNPDAVLHLLPGAPPQSMRKARSFWATLPAVAAVRAGRVYYVTDDYVLWPGQSMGKVAGRFADALHGPAAATRPAATQPAAAERVGRDTGCERLCSRRGGRPCRVGFHPTAPAPNVTACGFAGTHAAKSRVTRETHTPRSASGGGGVKPHPTGAHRFGQSGWHPVSLMRRRAPLFLSRADLRSVAA